MTDDSIRRALESLPPSDVVPKPELTREDLVELNALVGKQVQVTWPGRVLIDADGIPYGVEPPITETATMARPVITKAEAERLGWTHTEFPNIHVEGA